MKTRELRIVREYIHKGIRIHADIDLVAGKVSFVEFDVGKGWVPQKWVFAERDLDYVKVWSVILEGMIKVNREFIKILEEYKQEQLEYTVKGLAAMAKERKK